MRNTIYTFSRMLRTAAMLSAAAAAISCEMEFDIKDQFSDSIVFAEMIAKAGSDSTFLWVQAATPLKDASNPVYTRDEKIEVLVNGSSVMMQKDMKRSKPSSYQVYYTDRKLLPDDRIEITAEVPGSGTVQSDCVIPRPVRDFSYDTRIIRNGEDEYLSFNIHFPNTGEYPGYFGVAVEMESHEETYYHAYDEETGDYKVDEKGQYIYTLNSSSTHVRVCNPVNIGGDLGVSSSGDAPMTFSMSRDISHYNPVAAWSDTPGKGETSYTVNVRFDNDYFKDWGSMQNKVQYRYRLVMYDYSEGAYKYYKSRYNYSANDLSSVGLAAPSFLYTNIRNGIGVCGAYTVSESDWISLAY